VIPDLREGVLGEGLPSLNSVVVEQFKEFLDQVSPEDFAAGDS
jgi:hypothetical protein